MSTHPADQATIDARHAAYLAQLDSLSAVGEDNDRLAKRYERGEIGGAEYDEHTYGDLRLAQEDALMAAMDLLDALGYGRPGEAPLAEDDEDSPAPPARRWNQHSNDLGDWCPHSGDPVPAEDDDDAACPARCRSSYPSED